MDIEEMTALIAAELQDDVIGMVAKQGAVVTVSFSDGTERKVTVS